MKIPACEIECHYNKDDLSNPFVKVILSDGRIIDSRECRALDRTQHGVPLLTALFALSRENING